MNDTDGVAFDLHDFIVEEISYKDYWEDALHGYCGLSSPTAYVLPLQYFRRLKVQATELYRLGTPGDWAVDVAAATGLTRLSPHERQPLRASSTGTGALVREAATRGARSVIVGLGGSATVDGGKGALEALGFRFLDASGAPVAPGGAGLVNVAQVDDRGVPAGVRALVLCTAYRTGPWTWPSRRAWARPGGSASASTPCWVRSWSPGASWSGRWPGTSQRSPAATS